MADAVAGTYETRTEKKQSVRFDSLDEGAPMKNLYVPKDVLKQIDRLESGAIKVTIEAA